MKHQHGPNLVLRVLSYPSLRSERENLGTRLMAALSLFWNINKAAVTSCEHALLKKAYVHPNYLAFLFVYLEMFQFSTLSVLEEFVVK